MAKLRKLLALVLVMAMTFTMLPVFAAAEDISAVETVEAPTVENVAEISAGEPAAPVAEAIETVAAEPVAPRAELQAGSQYDDDDTALSAGMTVKAVTPVGGVVYYDTLQAAYRDAAAWTAPESGTTDCARLVLLCDVTYTDPNVKQGSSHSTALGTFSHLTNVNSCVTQRSTNSAYSYTNTYDPDTTVKGFWIDLNDKTFTLISQNAAWVMNADIPFNLCNGTFVHKYEAGATSTYQDTNATVRYANYTTSGTFGTADTVYQPEVTIKNANMYRLAAEGAADTQGPIIGMGYLNSTIRLINAKLISDTFAAIDYYGVRKDQSSGYAAVADYAATYGYHHDLILSGESVIGTPVTGTVEPTRANSALTSKAMPSGNALTFAKKEVTIVAQGDDVKFLGAAIATPAEGGATFVLPGNYDAAATCDVEIPDPTSIGLGDVPEMTPMEGCVAIGKNDHVHTLEHTEAKDATVEEEGNIEYWYCTSCERYYSDAEALHEISAEDIVIPRIHVHSLEHVEATETSTSAPGNVEYWHCTSCDKYYLDADATEETTAEAVVIAQLVPDPNVDPEEALVAYGYVAMTIAPDGTKTAYDTLKPAFDEALTWTGANGVVKLLQDYAYQETSARLNAGSLLTVKDRSAYQSWNQPNTTDPEKTVNGFWFDLGGHTLTTKQNGALFYVNESVPFSVKNGTILYEYTGTVSAYYIVGSVIQCGNPAGSYVQGVRNEDHVFCPEITLKDVNVYTTYTASDKGSSVVGICDLYSKVDIMNSTLIAGTYAVVYVRTSLTDAVDGAANPAAVTEERHQLSISATNGKKCVVGTAGTTSPIYIGTHAWPASRPNWNLPDDARSLTVVTSGNEDVVFVGGSPVGRSSSSSGYADKVAITMNGYADNGMFTVAGTYPVAKPDVATYAAAITAGKGAESVPTWLAPTDRPATTFDPHLHELTHVEAKEATPEEDGNVEYWYCDSCGKYFLDAEATQETTLAAVTLHVHAIEHVEAAAATTAAPGNVEYWRCATCGKLFLDAEGTQETTLEAVTIAQLVPDPNVDTDEALASYGYVIKNIAPDGTKTAFTTIPEALDEAFAWTEAGGVVQLLQDYTYVSTSSDSYKGSLYTVPGQDDYKSFDLDNDKDPELTVKGIWIDLGGHTLTTKSARPAFYMNDSVSLNFRNGRIAAFGTDSSSMAAQNSAFVRGNYGSPSGTAKLRNDTRVFHPTVTLKDVELYQLGNDSKTPSALYFANIESTVNIVDSKVICKDGYAVGYVRTDVCKNGKDGTFVPEGGLKLHHTVNVIATEPGKTVVGSAGSYRPIVGVTLGYSGLELVSKTITLNTTGGENVVFLGSSLANLADGVTFEYDTNYSGAGTCSVTMPDASTITAGAGMVPADLAPASYTSLLYQTSTEGLASFNGGEAKTLVEAFRDWAAAGYKGTITLNADPLAVDMNALYNEFGGKEHFSTTTSENGSACSPRVLLTEAMNGGNLTLDLGGNTIAISATILGTAASLNGFDLTIKNGTASTSGAYPALLLKGDAVRVKLDKVTLRNLSTSAANTIYDARGNDCWTILTDSELSSNTRGAINIYTDTQNVEKNTLLYYVKDGTFIGGAQAVITRLKLNTLSARRTAEFVFDGSNSFASENSFVTGVDGEETFLTAKSAITGPVDGVYSFTTDGSDSLLTTLMESNALLNVGEELQLPFKNATDAIRVAEVFGRGSLETTLTLDENVTVAESADIGRPGVASVFTLDLNSVALTDENNLGLIAVNGDEKTKVTINVTGAFGNAATEARFFAGLPALAYASGDSFVAEKGSLLTNYSLNLEDNVKINLYADEKNVPDSVGYVQDGKTYVIPAADEFGAWVVDTLAAKEMSKTISAYAAKKTGTTTKIDFSNGISVKGYAQSNPEADMEEAQAAALRETLDNMLVYGKYAEKYFTGDYEEITAEELAAIGLAEVPAADLSNLTDAAYVVTGMGDHNADANVESGFWGTAAVLADSICLKFYFSGEQFDGASATVNGEAAEVGTSIDGDYSYKFVQTPVAARNFDAPVTVEFAGVGSVTDSVSGYTSRITAENNAYKVVQALRAYGASAMRYYAAKQG